MDASNRVISRRLTNELDPDDDITEFAATGPKSYGFKTAKNKVVLKAKGVTLHSANASR